MQDFLTLVLEPFREVFAGFTRFAPNLLAMLTILIGGLVTARIVRWLLTISAFCTVPTPANSS